MLHSKTGPELLMLFKINSIFIITFITNDCLRFAIQIKLAADADRFYRLLAFYLRLFRINYAS
jgi:hypothetical protein